jgi:hypothetical protein
MAGVNPAPDIAALARQVAQGLQESYPALKSSSALDSGRLVSECLQSKIESVEKLKAAIAADDSLGNVRAGWIDSGNNGQSLQEHVLPHILIDSILNGERA